MFGTNAVLTATLSCSKPRWVLSLSKCFGKKTANLPLPQFYPEGLWDQLVLALPEIDHIKQ